MENKSEEKPAENIQGHSSRTGVYVGLGVLLVVLITAASTYFIVHNHQIQQERNTPQNDQTNQQTTSQTQPSGSPTNGNSSQLNLIEMENSTDPVQKGKALSNNMCTGSGSKSLTSAPLAAGDIGAIVPMGNMVGAHVTPIDHEYYYQKNPNAAPNTYKVLAPADGSIVAIQHRTQFIGNASDAPAQTDEYRIVISYSCTFFSYYDLMTGLDSSVSSKLPTDFATTGRMGNAPITIKAGQVIGEVGGQSLDFAVWDTTKQAAGLLNPIAFNNAEPWKVNTVPPLNYWSDSVKTEILPFYIRQAEPRDGKFDYDKIGTAIGDWFLAGTNGYRGGAGAQPPSSYWLGHLAIVQDAIDPTALVFSVGQFNGGDATQFAIAGNAPDPTTVTPTTGVVKYSLNQLDHVLPNGQVWTGSTFSNQIKVKAGAVKGVALIQLLDQENMKVEIFPGKTADQVSCFDDKVQIYTRAMDAKMIN